MCFNRLQHLQPINEDPVLQTSTEVLAGIAEADFGIDTTSQKRLRNVQILYNAETNTYHCPAERCSYSNDSSHNHPL